MIIIIIIYYDIFDTIGTYKKMQKNNLEFSSPPKLDIIIAMT